MRKYSIATVLAAVLLVLGTQPFNSPLVSAQSPTEATDAKAIFLAHCDALDAGDIDTAMSYIADDIINIILPPPPVAEPVSTGREFYQETISFLVSDNVDYEFVNIEVQGNALAFRTFVHTDLFVAMDVDPIEFNGTAVVENGLILSSTWLMDKNDEARLDAAIAQASNKALLLRGYEEVFNKGNFDVLDEDIAPNAIDHNFPDLQGVDAFKIPMMGLREAFPDLQATPNMIIAEGDLVMAHTTFTGTHEGEFRGVSPSGEQVTWSHVDINRIENGQVVEAWHIGSIALLEAIGFEMVPPGN